MSFDQAEFDFDAARPEDGYRNWLRRLDEQKRAFESRWGVILGRRVLLTLHEYDRPFEGSIHLVPNQRADGVQPLRLQIGRVVFAPADIASIVRLDHAEPAGRAGSPE